MKLGVLDLGSNSFHLLVARVDGDAIVPIDRHKKMVRLGAGTLRQGRIDADAMRRGLEAIAELSARARDGGARTLVAVATSALREARNAAELIDRARADSGIDIEVLSGEEEGRLIYRGASLGMPGRHAVVDIGGGSVEIVAGVAAEPRVGHRLPLGVLRLRESMVPEDGYVSDRTAEAIAAAVRAAAAGAVQAVRAFVPERLVFTSGTARTIARLAQQLAGPVFSEDRLRCEAIARLVVILTKLKPSGLVSLGVETGRTDTIAVGAVVMHTLVELFGFPAVPVSERALREGVALRELERRRVAARRSA